MLNAIEFGLKEFFRRSDRVSSQTDTLAMSFVDRGMQCVKVRYDANLDEIGTSPGNWNADSGVRLDAAILELAFNMRLRFENLAGSPYARHDSQARIDLSAPRVYFLQIASYVADRGYAIGHKRGNASSPALLRWTWLSHKPGIR